MLLLSALGTAFFPYASLLLLTTLALYFVILCYVPYAWLFVVPLALPLLDLAPWSGRLLYDEFDLLLLVTLAAALWRRGVSLRLWHVLPGPDRWSVAFFCLTGLVALMIGLFPLDALDANALSTYYSGYNSLRVGKGLLWALVLFALFTQAIDAYPEQARDYLFRGMIAGALALGLIVLWERGVFYDLLNARNKYQYFRGLLDFTNRDRITALFSQMHTGGSAVDGYLILIWPFTLVGLFLQQTRPLRLSLTLLAAIATSYGIAVTFTRMTYVAAALSFLTVAVALYLNRPPTLARGHIGAGVAVLFVTVGLGATAYAKGGILALYGVLLSAALAAAIGVYSERLERRGLTLRLGVAGLGLMPAVTYAIASSKWTDISLTEAALTASLLCALAIAGGFVAGRRCLRHVRLRTAVSTVVIAALAIGIAVQALGGYRMTTRFSAAAVDSQTRVTHWQDVLTAAGGGPVSRLFGTGLGSFPSSYAATHPETLQSIGNYAFYTEQGNQFLKLGGGHDLRVGQRVPLHHNSAYLLSFDARVDIPGVDLRVEFCRRNIRIAIDPPPLCIIRPVRLDGQPGEWQHLTLPVPIGQQIGAGGWYERPPTAILFRNTGKRTVVDLDNIAVTDASGHDIVVNGDFARGGDRWFSYNDFAHLPWHTKSLWLHLYFETGILGLIAFALVLACGLYRGGQGLRSGDGLSMAMVAAVIGFVVLGTTGSLLDAPRITTLFLLFVFSLCLLHARAARIYKPE